MYGVWAAETPDQQLRLDRAKSGLELSGSKMFCTAAGLVDRALITVCVPEQRLIDVNLRANTNSVVFDRTGWITSAFAETQTRTGFWHCGLSSIPPAVKSMRTRSTETPRSPEH